MTITSAENIWPELNWTDWSATGDTLHRFTQIVGKVRMALTPLINHWWNVTLYVTSRGLTTSPIYCGALSFEVTSTSSTTWCASKRALAHARKLRSSRCR